MLFELYFAEHSHLFEDQNKKDEILDNRLKEIYVTTQDESHTQKDTPSKPLPTERRSVEPPEFGYMEPAKVTKGKLSMRQALILIGKHSEDPTVYTAELLAHEHTIHPRVAGILNLMLLKQLHIRFFFFLENILKYFRTFEYYQPPSKTKAKISVKDYINLKSLPLMSKPNKDDQVETQRIKSD